MEKYIDKNTLIVEIEKLKENARMSYSDYAEGRLDVCEELLSFVNTLEVKEVDLLIHIIIAECCNWLAMNTNLSYDKIESCRELMLIIKEEQFKAQKGE